MTKYQCTVLLKDGTSFKTDLGITHIENLKQVAIVKKVITIGIILITYTILISPGLYNYYTKPARGGDWREVGSYIKENDKRRNSMVLISSFNLRSFNWYNKGIYNYCPFQEWQRIDLAMLFKRCKLDDIDLFWVIIRKRERGKGWESFYYKDSLFRIVEERIFDLSFRSPPVILYSFEKVKERSN